MLLPKYIIFLDLIRSDVKQRSCVGRNRILVEEIYFFSHNTLNHPKSIKSITTESLALQGGDE
jgi:hypothetical protein